MLRIADHLQEIHQQLGEAALRSGRRAEEITLLVVSKTFPPEAIREAAAHTAPLFAESRVQEALEKIPQLPAAYRWHFIGHLQSNKVRKILPLVEAVHSIDSLAIALDVDRIAGELGLRLRGYLQVNIAQDAAKFGFHPATLRRELETMLRLNHLDIVGLMTIPPAVKNPTENRPHFAALRELRDALEKDSSTPLPELSMGMSDDFPIAIEEGATIVRVGSRIFGGR